VGYVPVPRLLKEQLGTVRNSSEAETRDERAPGRPASGDPGPCSAPTELLPSAECHRLAAERHSTLASLGSALGTAVVSDSAPCARAQSLPVLADGNGNHESEMR